MQRTLTAALIGIVLALGCDAGPGSAGSDPAAARKAAAPGADQEVLIATVPAEANVLLAGAKVGKTPFRMLVRGNTNVVLEKEGYVRQAVLVTPDSEPNLVLELVPDGSAPAAEGDDEEGADDPAVESAPRATTKKTAAAVPEEAAAAQPSAGKDEDDKADQAPVEAAAAKAKAKAYDNMADLKRDHRAGIITAADYRHWQSVIRAKRAEELERLRQDLADGKLTKAEYKDKANAIRNKYEGR